MRILCTMLRPERWVPHWSECIHWRLLPHGINSPPPTWLAGSVDTAVPDRNIAARPKIRIVFKLVLLGRDSYRFSGTFELDWLGNFVPSSNKLSITWRRCWTCWKVALVWRELVPKTAQLKPLLDSWHEELKFSNTLSVLDCVRVVGTNLTCEARYEE